MNLDRKAIRAGLVLLLGVVLGCPRAQHPAALAGPVNRPYTIHIRTVNGQCNIDIPKLTVWQTDSTTIRWRSDDAPPKTYTVHFDPKDNPNQPKGTPFGPDDNPIYDITTSNNPLTPQRKGDFLYSVRPDTSTSPCIQATDPGLYVK